MTSLCNARISIEGSQLKLLSPTDIDITRGRYRIFFTTVAEMSSSDDFIGYLSDVQTNTSTLIVDIISYLNAANIEVDLDSTAQVLLEKSEAASDDLASARSRGQDVRNGVFSEVIFPGFYRKLKQYQIPAVAHMLAVGNAANFSVPGSGKTTMVLAAFARLFADGIVEKLIVVGPRSCFMPWEEEFAECFKRPANCIRFSGTASERAMLYRRFESANTELGLVTYQTATNDEESLKGLLRRNKVLLVLDESHYIKRMAGGARASALMALAPCATRRLILSGTPIPNGLEDLWSQMTFLWPNPPVLGSREKYRSRTERNDEATITSIRDELLPLFWRVKKSDVQLPKPEFHRIKVPLMPYQAAIYNALAVKILADVEHRPSEREKLREWRKAKMIRLLQAASNPGLLSRYSPEFRVPPLSAAGLSVERVIEKYSDYETPAKLTFVTKWAEELMAKGLKVIIWTTFIQNISTLEKMLSIHEPRVIHGSVPKDASEDESFNRERMIRDFKTNDKYKLLIANPGACAESISLHRICKHAIYLDRTFNGAQYMQSLDRIHRLGLDKDDKVHYYLFTSENTIDEVIDSRLEAKQAKLKKLLGDDLPIMDLDSDDEISEETDEEMDFEALVQQLKQQLLTNKPIQ